MLLPALPKQHTSSEATFGLAFRKWWATHPLPGSFELKHSRGKDSIPFKAVEQEQVAFALSARTSRGVLARVASGTIGCGDYIGLVSCPAWIVIKYTKHFYVISIASFLLEQERSTRKSLTEERARAIATYDV